MASPSSNTTTGSVYMPKDPKQTLTQVMVSGTYGTVTFVFEGSLDGSVSGSNWFPLAATLLSTGAVVSGTISPADDAELAYNIPSAGLQGVRLRITAIASGTFTVTYQSGAYVGLVALGSNSSGNTFSGATFNGTASTFSVMPIFPVNTTVAATGTVQANAAPVATGITVITGSGNAGVLLPTAVAGLVVILKNNIAGTLKVWPNTSDSINAIAADANYSVATLTTTMLFATDATVWESLPLVAS